MGGKIPGNALALVHAQTKKGPRASRALTRLHDKAPLDLCFRSLAAALRRQ
jgi:hypothetical protein